MAKLALTLAVMLAVATATFYVAGTYAAGSPWARDVCSLSREFCHSPGWLAAATAALALLALMLRALRF